MILVTGGTGFIGSRLVARLVAQGRPVRCLVRRSSSLANLPRSGVDLAYGDLDSGEGLPEAVRGVDTVIHLAGTTKATTVSGYDTGNATATANLLRAAGAVGRFVHVSSMAAAGPSALGRPLTEDAEAHYPPHPVSHYGRSKLAAEQAVRKSALWERTAMVRPPVVYGPGDKDVYQVLRAAARGWMVQIGSVDRRFSLIYVGDLVDGLIGAADSPTRPAESIYMAYRHARLLERIRRRRCPLDGAFPAHAGDTGEGCLRRRSVRRMVDAPERKTGHPLARQSAEACCAGWVCDPGRACRELGLLRSDGPRRRAAANTRLVQGGGLAEVLNLPAGHSARPLAGG